MNAVINDDSRKHNVEVHVVPSRYALALQKKNRKTNSGFVSKRRKPVPGVKVFSHVITREPSAIVDNRTPAAPMALSAGMFEHQSNAADLVARKSTNSSIASVLHSTPRPTFPTRISLHNMARSNRPIKVEELREGSMTNSSGANRVKDGVWLESNVRSEFQNNLTIDLSEGEDLKLLQNLYYQLGFVEAKTEDIFRRQEQRAEAQMMASWDILQSKIQKIQTSLRQPQSELIEKKIANLTKPTPQLAHHALDSMPQLCAFVKIALSRLSCSGTSCTNPLQLRLLVEALTSELDNLHEQIEAPHIGDFISNIVSVKHDIQ